MRSAREKRFHETSLTTLLVSGFTSAAETAATAAAGASFLFPRIVAFEESTSALLRRQFLGVERVGGRRCDEALRMIVVAVDGIGIRTSPRRLMKAGSLVIAHIRVIAIVIAAVVSIDAGSRLEGTVTGISWMRHCAHFS